MYFRGHQTRNDLPWSNFLTLYCRWWSLFSCRYWCFIIHNFRFGQEMHIKPCSLCNTHIYFIKWLRTFFNIHHLPCLKVSQISITIFKGCEQTREISVARNAFGHSCRGGKMLWLPIGVGALSRTIFWETILTVIPFSSLIGIRRYIVFFSAGWQSQYLTSGIEHFRNRPNRSVISPRVFRRMWLVICLLSDEPSGKSSKILELSVVLYVHEHLDILSCCIFSLKRIFPLFIWSNFKRAWECRATSDFSTLAKSWGSARLALFRSFSRALDNSPILSDQHSLVRT